MPGNFHLPITRMAHDRWIAIKDAVSPQWNRCSDTFTSSHSAANPIASPRAACRHDGRARSVWIVPAMRVSTSRSCKPALLASAPSGVCRSRWIYARAFTLTLDRIRVPFGIVTESGLGPVANRAPPFDHVRPLGADPHALSGDPISRVLEDRAGAGGSHLYGGLNRLDRTVGWYRFSVTIRQRKDPR